MDIGRNIEAPARLVWAVMTDVAMWPRWGPSVSTVESTDRHIKFGSTGRVRIPLGLWLPFEVTSMSPGRSWSWRVGGVAATGHRVEPLGNSRCRLVFEIPYWAAPYALVCRVAAGRIAQICADRLRDSGNGLT